MSSVNKGRTTIPVGPPKASGRTSKRTRRTRVDQMTTMWMILAVALIVYSVVFHGRIPQEWWTAVHVVTLGVITNAIMQWSWHFAKALLRLRPDNRQAGIFQVVRQVLFNLFLIGLIAGMWTANWVLTIIFATLIGIVIAWHAMALLTAGRGALSARFAVVVKYYGIAAVFLVLGIVLSGFTIAAMFAPAAPPWLLDFRSATTLAHAIVNGLGWVGVTILGTVITLWPTMLRTRLVDGAEEKARAALPIIVGAVLVASVASAVNLLWVAAIAVLLYLLATILGIGVPLVQEALVKPPTGYPTWSALAGFIWSLVGIAWMAVVLFVSTDSEVARADLGTVVVVLGVGGILQIFIGALSYLMPVVVGGGPGAVRVGIAVLEKFGGFRIALRNAALVLALAASGTGSPTLVSIWALLCALSFAMDIGMFAASGISQSKAKRPRAGGAA